MTLDVRGLSVLTIHLFLLLAVSEIAITRCMVSASMVGDMCAPATTVEQDAVKGKWVRVERDLNLQSGLWFLVRPSAYMRSSCGL